MPEIDRRLVFYHAPNTRSLGVAVLLEELGAPHERRLLNLAAGEQRLPAYLAINPMGKVPAIVHGDAVVTEQVAIFLYLADLFADAGLAPGITDPLRGPYLRWMVFYAACFEPSLLDVAMKREPGPAAMSPYGEHATVLRTLSDQLSRGPYMLGERFSAADVLWGFALAYTTQVKLVPELPEIMAYVARVNARPAVAKIRARDAQLAAAQQPAG